MSAVRSMISGNFLFLSWVSHQPHPLHEWSLIQLSICYVGAAVENKTQTCVSKKLHDNIVWTIKPTSAVIMWHLAAHRKPTLTNNSTIIALKQTEAVGQCTVSLFRVTWESGRMYHSLQSEFRTTAVTSATFGCMYFWLLVISVATT